MTPPTRRPYRGASADERRARRRAALLEAGLELLGTQGRAATTVRGVCTRASLNDRYFYESFPDLDALLVAVFDDVAGRGEAAIIEAITTAPREPMPRVRAVVTAVVGFLTADPRDARLLLREIQADRALLGRRHRLVRRLADIFTAQVHELVDDLSLSGTDLELTALTLISGSMELVATWLRGELSVDREHLIDFIVTLMITSAGLPSAVDRAVRGAPTRSITDSITD